MTNIGHQSAWLTGARLYFQRDPVGGVTQPTIDLGVINPTGPSFDVTTAQLVDSDGGSNAVVAEEVVSMEEAYEIVCSNLNLDNLNLMFYGTQVEPYSQSATPVTNRVIYAHPGRLVKIVDADGNAEVGLASIDAVTGPGGAPIYAVDVDWEVVDLERGLIRMIAGGAFTTAGDIEVDYTRRAISAEERLVYPQTSRRTIEGKALVFWGRESNTEQTMREMRVSLSVSASSFQNTEFSNFTMRLKVLYDRTRSTDPAGRMLSWLGTLPPKS